MDTGTGRGNHRKSSARPFRGKGCQPEWPEGRACGSPELPERTRHSRESASASAAGFPPGASAQQPGQRRPCLPVPAAQEHGADSSPDVQSRAAEGKEPDPGPPPSGARPHATSHHHPSAGQEAEPTVHRAHSGRGHGAAGQAWPWPGLTPSKPSTPWSPDTQGQFHAESGVSHPEPLPRAALTGQT